MSGLLKSFDFFHFIPATFGDLHAIVESLHDGLQVYCLYIPAISTSIIPFTCRTTSPNSIKCCPLSRIVLGTGVAVVLFVGTYWSVFVELMRSRSIWNSPVSHTVFEPYETRKQQTSVHTQCNYVFFGLWIVEILDTKNSE